jgi:hypothetical protein
VLGGQTSSERLPATKFFNNGLELVRHLSPMIATNGNTRQLGYVVFALSDSSDVEFISGFRVQ